MFLKLFNKIGATGIFLIIVFITYFLFFLFDSKIVFKSLLESFLVLKEWFLILVLIFILMTVFDMFINNKSIIKLFFKKNIFISWFLIIVSGVISTGPIYMWYPLLSKLKEKGLENKFIVAFLYNRSVKLPLLLPMIEVFGLKIVIILSFSLIIFSVLNGYIVDYLIRFINNENI